MATLARTTLVVPVTFAEASPGGSAGRAEALARRTFPTRGLTEAPAPMWHPKSPPERLENLDHLAPAFQLVLGAGAGPSGAYPWTPRWLRLNDPMIDGLLADARPNGGRAAPVPRLRRVDLHLYPLDVGLFSLLFDWPGDVDPGAVRDALPALVSLRDRQHGWRFGPAEGPRPEQLARLPEALRGAHLPDARVPLATLLDWLLDPDATDPPPRVEGRRAFAHTSLFLAERPSDAELHALLYGLRRAADARQPPPAEPSPREAVIALRANRVATLAREGAALVGWPQAGTDPAFEQAFFRKRAHALYLHLLLHAHAEQATLGRLARDAAVEAGGLGSPDTVAQRRDHLFDLARRMTTYTLSMVGDDPGGTTDYGTWFRAAREALGIPATLAEVRAEVRELFELVEAAYEREQQRSAAEAGRREEAFHRAVTVFGTTIGAAGLATGIFGVNLPFPWPGTGALAWTGWLAFLAVLALTVAVTHRILKPRGDA